VPRRIFLVDRIPRGATGKPKRYMLTAEFGTAAVSGTASALQDTKV
jgi:acyl-coenzyme A synthetase/AMP-(fatty) acid ligase